MGSTWSHETPKGLLCSHGVLAEMGRLLVAMGGAPAHLYGLGRVWASPGPNSQQAPLARTLPLRSPDGARGVSAARGQGDPPRPTVRGPN